MNLTKIDSEIQSVLQKQIISNRSIQDILYAIQEQSGVPLLVGGAVRDLLLGIAIKDLDIEVHHISLHQLESLLQKFGPVRYVGKVFGVLRIDGIDIDWAIPRSDTSGRKPEVTLDPYMGIVKAAARRDLTMNAMAINLITYELLDPFQGQQDMQAHILRTPDENFFAQDPLRLFRVMQFIGRFQMFPDQMLDTICARMDIRSVSQPRIYQEFEKLLLQSKQPSLGIRWLERIGRLQEIMPELYDTIHTKQNYEWHPEGSVFEHSMQALDAAGDYVYHDKHTKLVIMFGALCHDLGKVTATQYQNGRWTSYNHAEQGVPLARALLTRLGVVQSIIKAVMKLVQYHMAPVVFIKQQATRAAYKRLAVNLAPEVSIQLLVDVARADHRARNPDGLPFSHNPTSEIDIFLQHAEQALVTKSPEKPLLRASDIADLVSPGKVMGELLRYAYHVQIEEEIADKELLKHRVKKYFNEM